MDYITNIVQIRKAHKESQAQVAEYLNIPQQQYSRYENGKNELPIRYLIELCKHWNTTPNVILGFGNK